VRIVTEGAAPGIADSNATECSSPAGRTDASRSGSSVLIRSEPIRFDEFVREGLRARNDPRSVVADPVATYFGTALGERSLVPGPGAQLAPTRFEDWLKQSMAAAFPVVADLWVHQRAVFAIDGTHQTTKAQVADLGLQLGGGGRI
jgi:hypothetical protein